MGIERQAGLLEEKKQLLKKKEQIIKEKERRLRAKNFEEIGRIASSAKITDLDRVALLGAFLEIASKSSNQSQLNQWKTTAENFEKQSDSAGKTPISISFEAAPSAEVKSWLKERKFKWNSFRGEYYGYGNLEEVNSFLKKAEPSFKAEELK